MATPTTAAPQKTAMKVNIKISCKDLPNLDTLSKSDPMAVVFEKRDDSDWKEVGRTEMIKDSLNPDFTKMIKIDYFFEKYQKLRFDVYDVDSSSTGSLSGNDFIGSAEISFSDLLTKRRCHYVDELTHKDKKGRGTISVLCEQDEGNDDHVELKLSGEDLDKKDLFGKSDPYFILYKKMSDGSLIKVYQSKTIMKTLNPSWESFKMRVWDLCGKDLTQEIKIECFDWDKHSSDDLIGEATFTLEKLVSPGGKKSVELIHPKLKSKKKYKNSGVIKFDTARILKTYPFVDFLRGGLEINFMTAIDFTGSNGDPQYESSLHYINPDGSDNAYMKAIRSVGSILAAYDKDQMFPVHGYGAKLPNGKVSHCFPLNENESNPEVCGVQGILDVYKQTLNKVELCGPTNFANVINNASKIAKEEMEKNPYKYFVLLILTDGAISDMNRTIDAIVEASNKYPLSIVITGIGNANFSNMDKLDGDDDVLKSLSGVKAQRDIVQFVPFNKYSDKPQLLAQETLAEIPKQVVSYMAMKGISPTSVQPDISIPAGQPAPVVPADKPLPAVPASV